MKTINFDQVPDAGEYAPLPEGRYTVEIERAEGDVNQRGDDVLKLLLRVSEGEQSGAVIFDRLYFTNRALPRLKGILKAIGVEPRGSIEVTPDLLRGKRCQVDVVVDSYVKADGSEGKTNAIPYTGYHPAAEGSEAIAPY